MTSQPPEVILLNRSVKGKNAVAHYGMTAYIATLGHMYPDKDADSSGSDPQATEHQISFPWDVEPPDKWKIQFYYTPISEIHAGKVNQYSLASNETSEGGGFQYEDCPKIFFGRNGYGALRLAWDTNILIDYAKYGKLIWAEDEPDFPVEEEHYQEELIALREIMNLWMIRDIRIRMPFRQINDAKIRLEQTRRT